MIETTGNDLVVIASDPQELVEAQVATIGRVAQKLADARAELAEAQEIKAACDMAKIDNSAAAKLITKSNNRILYLEKVKTALESGFVLVPNFPGDTIAIRVRRQMPEQSSKYGKDYPASVENELAQTLPAGEGRYVDPKPKHSYTMQTVGGKQTHDLSIWGFDDDIALPAEFLRPNVIKRTGAALKMKVFDELVVAVGVKGGDPMVIGRIYDYARGRKWYQRKAISFLVAWFVNTSAI